MARKATMDDAENIKKILSAYAKKGKMLDRSLLDIYENIRDFFVAEKEGKFAGCCALHFCWQDLAEIRSLAVKEEFKGNGLGKELANACLEEAKKMSVKKAFTLSFAPDFFKGIGFKEIKKEELPHKIWKDCLNCVHFPKCEETALEKEIK